MTPRARSAIYRRAAVFVAACIVVLCAGVAAFQSQTQQATPPVSTAPQGTTRDTMPPPPVGTASISGTVVNALNGVALAHATVRLTGTSAPMGNTSVTDQTGSFSLRRLPAGEYTLMASADGFTNSTYGQKHPGDEGRGRPIALGDGQVLTRIVIPIAPDGRIAGVISDENKVPLRDVQVTAFLISMRTGERHLEAVGTVQSDSHGRYGLAKLAPGDYVIGAAFRDQVSAMAALKEAQTAANATSLPGADDVQHAGYAPAFFPSVPSASMAQTVTIGMGDVRDGIDVQLPVVPLGRLTGELVGGDTRLLSGVTIQLFNTQLVPDWRSQSTSTGPDGKFVFSDLPPSVYTMFARVTASKTDGVQIPGASLREALDDRGGADVVVMWATTDAASDGRNPASATLVLQPGMTVTGRIVFDGATPAPADASKGTIRLGILIDADPLLPLAGFASATLDGDGRFKITGVAPMRYRVIANVGPWRAKSAEVDGHDVLDLFDVRPGESVGGMLVTMTDRVTALSGMVKDANDQPTADCTVIVFQQDRRLWTPGSRRVLAVRPSVSGHYSVQGLLPGDYRVLAVEDVEPGRWYDPAYLQAKIGASVAVTLGDGGRYTQDLRVVK